MSFERLVKIMEELMGPRGCPWDKKQTRDTLKQYLLEESYELLEALDSGDSERIKEELGDLLFQIIFHSHISKGKGQFDINDVINRIADKMIRRHPHVFGEKSFDTTEEFMAHWDNYKKIEGKKCESILDGIPQSLPALLKAHKLQDRVSSVGFDWKRVEDVFEKLDEELRELKSALKKNDRRAIEDELGDIFFVLVRVSSFIGVNPEDALRKTTTKFINRFKYMESHALEQGRRLSDMTLEEMDVLWEEAKNVFDFDDKEKGA